MFFCVFQASASAIEVCPRYLRRSIVPYHPPHVCKRSPPPHRHQYLVAAAISGSYRPKTPFLRIASCSMRD
ncbi:hypothetical protein B0H10DRAFT_2084971 [Mycena sp. CBHHK59/15]|nr:hypothetical protein B0H10DRAFT_2098613 [Mycena sp. CBHHK59/15]KAJ6598759.1 hypothetical protein B0H10DRAFT_2084971 [Mycena sp. CBHHK59/15]